MTANEGRIVTAHEISNRNRKGTLRKYINNIIVFGVSGLWHGASWNYVVWGMLHAVYNIVGDIKNKILKGRGRSGEVSFSSKLRKGIITFALVDFAWIFFAANRFKDAIGIIRQMTTSFMNVSLLNLGLSTINWRILIVASLLLMVVDVLHERGISINKLFMKQEVWFRWLAYLILLWSIVMFGIYGPSYDTSTFIYFQF